MGPRLGRAMLCIHFSMFQCDVGLAVWQRVQLEVPAPLLLAALRWRASKRIEGGGAPGRHPAQPALNQDGSTRWSPRDAPPALFREFRVGQWQSLATCCFLCVSPSDRAA